MATAAETLQALLQDARTEAATLRIENAQLAEANIRLKQERDEALRAMCAAHDQRARDEWEADPAHEAQDCDTPARPAPDGLGCGCDLCAKAFDTLYGPRCPKCGYHHPTVGAACVQRIATSEKPELGPGPCGTSALRRAELPDLKAEWSTGRPR